MAVCYVDDVLGISMNTKGLMQVIEKDFVFKKDKFEQPKMYLGAYLEKKFPNGNDIWTMCSKDYNKLVIVNVESQLTQKGMKLPSKATIPMNSEYSPEVDVSDELDSEDITFYRQIIGIIRWAIEILRVDINREVSLLSSCQAAPRVGHLEQPLHMLAFLKKKRKFTLYFDSSDAIIDEAMFV